MNDGGNFLVSIAEDVMPVQHVPVVRRDSFHAIIQRRQPGELKLLAGLGLEDLGDAFQVFHLDGDQPPLACAKAGLDDAPGGLPQRSAGSRISSSPRRSFSMATSATC